MPFVELKPQGRASTLHNVTFRYIFVTLDIWPNNGSHFERITENDLKSRNFQNVPLNPMAEIDVARRGWEAYPGVVWGGDPPRSPPF